MWWRCYLGPMQCHQSTLKMSAGGFVIFPGWCDGACTSASLDCMPHPFVLPLAGACVATVAHVAVMLAVLLAALLDELLAVEQEKEVVASQVSTAVIDMH